MQLVEGEIQHLMSWCIHIDASSEHPNAKHDLFSIEKEREVWIERDVSCTDRTHEEVSDFETEENHDMYRAL